MYVVRKGGLEPPRYCYRQPLKLVRLPIPPLPRGCLAGVMAKRRISRTMRIRAVVVKSTLPRRRVTALALVPPELEPASQALSQVRVPRALAPAPLASSQPPVARPVALGHPPPIRDPADRGCPAPVRRR